MIVGSGAQVLGPITVGEGARIGANAVVLTDVPKDATMVGIPAKVAMGHDKKSREIILRLMAHLQMSCQTL